MSLVLDRVKENAKKNPDRVAYFHVGVNGNKEQLTWSELERYSDNLSLKIDWMCSSKSPVVVYGHKDPFMVVAFLGCVKSGRAYCPIDTSVPDDRVRTIISSLNPELVIDISGENNEIFSDVKLWKKDDLKQYDEKQCCDSAPKRVEADDVFYIIYTSGSTGNPKGVQITSSCLDNFVRWAITLGTGVDETGNNVFLNTAPFSFDLSVMDLYMSLYTGGTLWTMDKELLHDIRKVTSLLSESEVNISVATPSFINMCFADKEFKEENLKFMEKFLFCGETLPAKLVRKIRDRFPSAEIVNTYGPTESTCAITEVMITDEVLEQYDSLPIGSPKAGTWISIVDGNGTEVNEGEKGEIVIIGDSVSVGYYGQDSLTQEKFGKAVVMGEEYRSYRTGDAGYIKDGLLFYEGRIDLQIKLNGYRIELEDIENNMSKIAGIEDVVVLPNVKEGSTEVRSLTAYVVTEKDTDDKSELVNYFKTQARNYLPEYMIPKKMVIVDFIPMTTNGKKDRKKARSLWG